MWTDSQRVLSRRGTISGGVARFPRAVPVVFSLFLVCTPTHARRCPRGYKLLRTVPGPLQKIHRCPLEIISAAGRRGFEQLRRLLFFSSPARLFPCIDPRLHRRRRCRRRHWLTLFFFLFFPRSARWTGWSYLSLVLVPPTPRSPFYAVDRSNFLSRPPSPPKPPPGLPPFGLSPFSSPFHRFILTDHPRAFVLCLSFLHRVFPSFESRRLKRSRIKYRYGTWGWNELAVIPRIGYLVVTLRDNSFHSFDYFVVWYRILIHRRAVDISVGVHFVWFLYR